MKFITVTLTMKEANPIDWDSLGLEEPEEDFISTQAIVSVDHIITCWSDGNDQTIIEVISGQMVVEESLEDVQRKIFDAIAK